MKNWRGFFEKLLRLEPPKPLPRSPEAALSASITSAFWDEVYRAFRARGKFEDKEELKNND